MKLIHCADLHLDSPMESSLPPEKARERKNELLGTFSRLVSLAGEGGVSAILIAGDLFDSTHITGRTEKYVLDLIRRNHDLLFFYLAGNHDRGAVLRAAEEKPANLMLFSDGWTSYDFGGVMITGSERPDPDTLSLSPDRLNIVLMHGQARSGKGTEKADIINFGKYKDKGIDYLALGHIHEYKEAAIDTRCTACYSGCLEGRGFDECGKKGYVLLETTGTGKLQHTFVPLAKRTLHAVECDVTGCSSQLELEERLSAATDGIPAGDLVRAVLTGTAEAENTMDLRHLASTLGDRFYFAAVKNETRLSIRPEDYLHDLSLKGEFVRRVLASDLSESEKNRVIVCGLRVLDGEETGL